MESCFSPHWQTQWKKSKGNLVLNSNGVGVVVVHFLRQILTKTLHCLWVTSFSNYFPELRRTPKVLYSSSVGCCSSNTRTKSRFRGCQNQSFRARFPFLKGHTWGIVYIFPWILGKLFLCFLPILHFETRVGVLALVFVEQSGLFSTWMPVDKMRKMDFKPHFLLPWKSLSEKKVVEPRRHWNSSRCSHKTFMIHFTKTEKKGFATKLSTFSLKCTPHTGTPQLNRGGFIKVGGFSQILY